MGLFSTPSPFDQYVERATSEKNTGDDWGLIMDLCDRVKESPNGSKDCLKSITKRLSNENPRVVLQTITLLDACINNCGRKFQLEVASRDFEQELNKIITSTRTHHKVSEKLREHLKKWAETEFKGDPELSLIPSLYTRLKGSGYDFNVGNDSPKRTATYSTDPNVVSSQQEEDDIARAIQLSLQNSGSNTQSAKVQSTKQSPTAASPYSGAISALSGETSVADSSRKEVEKELLKVRAIYDFEAAEDNELTFKAGEIVSVIDNSDPNWWKGTNQRGEGLFPANFVTTDVDGPIEEEVIPHRSSNKRVSFSESVVVTEVNNTDFSGPTLDTEPIPEEAVTGQVDEDKIDHLLNLIHEADPTGERPDDVGMTLLEAQVNAMAPSIDAELERIDRKHAQLARSCTDLVNSMNLYHQLMREMPPSVNYYPAYSMPGTAVGQGMPSHYPQYTNPMVGAPPQPFPGHYPPYMPPTTVGPPAGASFPQAPAGLPIHQVMANSGPTGQHDPGLQKDSSSGNSSMGPGYAQFTPGMSPQGIPFQPPQQGLGDASHYGPVPNHAGHGMPPSAAPAGIPQSQPTGVPQVQQASGPPSSIPGQVNMMPNNVPPVQGMPNSLPQIQGQPLMAPASGSMNMPTSSVLPNNMPFYTQPPLQSLQP